ncbi:MAG: sodium/solute symporter [Eubacteriales bacterium]
MVSVIDIGIIIGYLVLMMVVGYVAGRNNTNQEDYFLAGRSMPWLPIALSVAATMISANGFIGGPGWAYTSGMSPVMVNIAVPLAVVFALSITTPVIYRMNVTSVYQYMEKRLGKYSKTLTIIQFFVNSIIQISSMVYIPVLILQAMTGWSFYVLVPLVVITSIIYTLLGGIRAVIWTDSIQMVLVIGAVVLVIATALSEIGLGFFDTLSIAQEAGKLDTMIFTTDITVENAFWATLIGGFVMWFRYFCFDQSQVQRVLTAKSLKSAKNAFVVSAIVMNVVYYIMLLVGVFLFVFYDGKAFETSNEVMITFILNEMPVGAIGLIIAGVFAAAMSSVDSLLNSMTAVFTKDVYETLFHKEKEATLKVSMIISVVIGIAMTIVIFIGFNGSVKSILDTVGSYISYFAGPAAGAFILAMFTKKANDKGVSIGFVLGLIVGYYIAVTYHVNWLWNPFIGATITCICGYFISLIFYKEDEMQETYEYTALGMRKRLIQEGVEDENGVRTLPFTMGKHEVIVIGFFVIQYIILYVIQY